VKSWFPHLTEVERLALIQRLFDESRVRESEKLLAYDLMIQEADSGGSPSGGSL